MSMSFPSKSSPVGTLAPVPLALLHWLVVLPVLTLAWVRMRRTPPTTPTPVFDADAPLFSPHGQVELSVVVPFFNPGDCLRPTIESLVSDLSSRGVAFEIIAVDDGSTDSSATTIRGIADEVQVITAPHNMGKGAALHRGFAHARGTHIGFIDADGDIDAHHIADYLTMAKAGDHDVVYASKRHAGSVSASSAARKLISYGFIALVTMLFRLGVQDTQTGCKVFHRRALATVLPRLREHRFAFDLEFFVAARAAGISRMHPAPVRLNSRMAGSTVTHSTVARTLTDALNVFARLRLTPAYSPASDSIVAGASPNHPTATLALAA